MKKELGVSVEFGVQSDAEQNTNTHTASASEAYVFKVFLV